MTVEESIKMPIAQSTPVKKVAADIVKSLKVIHFGIDQFPIEPMCFEDMINHHEMERDGDVSACDSILENNDLKSKPTPTSLDHSYVSVESPASAANEDDSLENLFETAPVVPEFLGMGDNVMDDIIKDVFSTSGINENDLVPSPAPADDGYHSDVSADVWQVNASCCAARQQKPPHFKSSAAGTCSGNQCLYTVAGFQSETLLSSSLLSSSRLNSPTGGRVAFHDNFVVTTPSTVTSPVSSSVDFWTTINPAFSRSYCPGQSCMDQAGNDVGDSLDIPDSWMLPDDKALNLFLKANDEPTQDQVMGTASSVTSSPLSTCTGDRAWSEACDDDSLPLCEDYDAGLMRLVTGDADDASTKTSEGTSSTVSLSSSKMDDDKPVFDYSAQLAAAIDNTPPSTPISPSTPIVSSSDVFSLSTHWSPFHSTSSPSTHSLSTPPPSPRKRSMEEDASSVHVDCKRFRERLHDDNTTSDNIATSFDNSTSEDVAVVSTVSSHSGVDVSDLKYSDDLDVSHDDDHHIILKQHIQNRFSDAFSAISRFTSDKLRGGLQKPEY